MVMNGSCNITICLIRDSTDCLLSGSDREIHYLALLIGNLTMFVFS